MPRDTPIFLPLPPDLSVPDGTGLLFDGAMSVTPTGPPLVVSNSPEQMAGSEPVLVLCRVRLPEWRARLFFHHQNIGGPLRIAPFFLNHGTAPLELYVARASGDSAERPGGAVDGDPAVAGLNTLRSYFESRSDGGEVDHYLATVAPGSRVLIAARDVPRGHTACSTSRSAQYPGAAAWARWRWRWVS